MEYMAKIVLEKEYVFLNTEEELDWPSVVRARLLDCGIVGVIIVSEQEYGMLSFSLFSNECEKEILEDRSKFLEFIRKNEGFGYSVEGFDTVDDLNEYLQRERITGYGTFKPFDVFYDIEWSEEIAESMTDDEWNHLHDNDPRKTENVLF